MDWIFDHLQLLVIVASAFAWWISQRKQKAEEEKAARRELEEPRVDPADEFERARRIQEEIRRKIAQRRGLDESQVPPYTAPQPPPLQVPRPLVVEEAPLPPARPLPDYLEEDRAGLERQQQLAERMRELAEQRREAERAARRALEQVEAPAVRAARTTTAAQRLEDERAWLRAALRDRGSARRAMVLREVLGPPLGLR